MPAALDRHETGLIAREVDLVAFSMVVLADTMQVVDLNAWRQQSSVSTKRVKAVVKGCGKLRDHDKIAALLPCAHSRPQLVLQVEQRIPWSRFASRRKINDWLLNRELCPTKCDFGNCSPPCACVYVWFQRWAYSLLD